MNLTFPMRQQKGVLAGQGNHRCLTLTSDQIVSIKVHVTTNPKITLWVK